jgi:hypothetical protein
MTLSRAILFDLDDTIPPDDHHTLVAYELSVCK